jgi:hypothetical protein
LIGLQHNGDDDGAYETQLVLIPLVQGPEIQQDLSEGE